MDKIFNIINIPLGFILEWISKLVGGNFAASVFIFTLVINIAMLPLSIKGQKSSVQQLRLRPKLDALKEKYGDDQRRYSEAMQELYAKENVSMTGGCLPMLIRLPIMFSIYYLVRSPLQYLAHVSTDVINKGIESLKALNIVAENQLAANGQLLLLEHAKKINIPEITAAASELDFSFFGIDLTETPKFSMDIINSFNINWIIPILAGVTAIISSLISMSVQKKANPDAPSMMGMMLIMPIFSMVIAFGFPCALGFYWACSSLIGGLVQGAVQRYYGPQNIIAKERAKELEKAYNEELARIEKISD